MRVLMLVHSLRRGGAERVLLEFALGLAKRGHVLSVVGWLDTDEYTEERYALIPRCFLMKREDYRWPWSLFAVAGALRRAATAFRPDAIMIHSPTVAWAIMLAQIRVPMVHVLHGFGAIERGAAVKDRVVRTIDRSVQKILGCSFVTVAPTMIRVASIHFSTSEAKFRHVPNGIDPRAFDQVPRHRSQRTTVLMVGTLCLNKGQRHGIKAIKLLSSMFPAAELLLVGDGPDRMRLEEHALELGIAPRVKFLGRREDVRELMASADVLWQLSASEGFPMIVLEAMASGLPIVGYDVRGTRDVIRDENLGWLVPYGDVDQVAHKTAELFQNDVKYRTLSENGRRLVGEELSLDAMIDGHENALMQAVDLWAIELGGLRHK